MHIWLLILLLKVIVGRCSTRDQFETNFIVSFIANENKSTVFVYYDSCWRKSEQIFLTKKLSASGVRVSASSIIGSSRRYQEHNVLFFIDLGCDNSHQSIKKASSKNLFRSPHRWLLVTKSTGSHHGVISQIPALPDSDVVLVERKGDIYDMLEIHRPSLNHTLIFTPRGSYNGTLTDIRPRKELYRRRMDLLGHTLTMTNVIQDSNSTRYHLPMETGLELENDAISKLCWMTAKLGILMLNATPSYTFSYRWGYKVDGQWSGMIEDLRARRADLGTNCVVSDTQRLSVVSYTDTLAPFHVRFIFRQPPLTYVSNIYSLPFSSKVWVSTAICGIVTAIAICVATKWETRFIKKSGTQLDGGIGDAAFLTLSALSQQGCVMEPNTASGRILVWTVFVVLMALHAAYSANIVALLQAPSRSITSLPQLAASKITLAGNDVDYNHFVFKIFKDPVHVAVGKRVQPDKGPPLLYDIEEGVERIRQGLFAFHSITEPVYRRIERTFLESEKCDLNEIDYLGSLPPYVPMRKGSPYLELIKVAFKRIIETGIRTAMNNRYQVPKPRCSGNTSAFSSVGVQDMRAVLALMAIGIGVSVAILIVEIIVHKLMNKSKVPKQDQFQET